MQYWFEALTAGFSGSAAVAVALTWGRVAQTFLELQKSRQAQQNIAEAIKALAEREEQRHESSVKRISHLEGQLAIIAQLKGVNHEQPNNSQ